MDEDIQFIYNSLTKVQQIEFFIALANGMNVQESVKSIIEKLYEHDDLDVFLSPDNKLIIGNDFFEYYDTSEEDEGALIDVQNFIHIYSNRKKTIEEHIRNLIEDGEIIVRLSMDKHDGLYHGVFESLNFNGDEYRPIIPIMYN